MKPVEILWMSELRKAELGQKPRAIIVDIDGTLSNSDHREHLIHNGKRDEYFSLVSGDELNEWCADLISEYKGTHKVILLTGRPESVRKDTVNWLEYWGVEFDLLIMRGESDREQGFVYKKKIYNNFLKPYFDVKLVIDNDPLICEMFRQIGIPCLEYEQEMNESDISTIEEICSDLRKLVEAHHAGDTKTVVDYHEQIDTALHNLVGKEGLRPEEK